MREAVKAFVLKFLKVPPEPEAPVGSPESIQVFRAAPNFLRLCLIKWVLKQITAILVLAGAVVLFHYWGGFDRLFGKGHFHFHTILIGIHLTGVGAYVLLMPFTYAMVWLDYEMRWYIVTDRSLRIRSGLVRVREMTMTYANIQQISIGQGPLQRWLGIADLQVTTAGGGGAPASPRIHGEQLAGESMHVGYFHGIDNAAQVRDLMLERLRRLRDAGLGDPDENPQEEPPAMPDSQIVIDAAGELVREARALRQILAE